MDEEFAKCVVKDLRMLADRSYQSRAMIYIILGMILLQSGFIGFLLFNYR